MKLGRILVWRKETSRMTSMPDFTVEIEIEDIRAELYCDGEDSGSVRKGKEEVNEMEEYKEPRVIRGDTTVFLGLRLVEKSGLRQGQKIVVKTEEGSKKIIIEPLKKSGE